MKKLYEIDFEFRYLKFFNIYVWSKRRSLYQNLKSALIPCRNIENNSLFNRFLPHFLIIENFFYFF